MACWKQVSEWRDQARNERWSGGNLSLINMNFYPGWTWLSTCLQVWRERRRGGGEEEPETDWQSHKQVENLWKSLSENRNEIFRGGSESIGRNVNQAWAKMHPGTSCGPWRFFVSPSKLEEMMLLLINWLDVILFFSFLTTHFNKRENEFKASNKCCCNNVLLFFL